MGEEQAEWNRQQEPENENGGDLYVKDPDEKEHRRTIERPAGKLTPPIC